MKTKKFKLSHVVLYAKGWYLRTEDKWEDLKKILELDGYTPFSNGHVYSILVRAFGGFDFRATELSEILIGIHPYECWKYGYYTKNCTWLASHETLPTYKMEDAILHYILSTLQELNDNRWNKVIPKYKLYPKPYDIELKQVINVFKNKKS